MMSYLKLLGVEGREDSYTDFLINYFESNKEFRTKLYKKLFNMENLEYDTQLRVKTREKFRIYVDENKKDIVPDIIIYENEEMRCLVEVKLLSFEHENQTDFYNEFSKNIELKYFLTLDCDNARCKDFTPISWEDVVDLFEINGSNNEIDILANEIKKIISEYYEVVNLVDKERPYIEIENELRNKHVFLSENRLIKNIINFENNFSMEVKDMFNLDISYYNDHSGLQLILSKDCWKIKVPGEDKKDRFIIKIMRKKESIELVVCYEVFPYCSKIDYEKKYGKESYEAYVNRRTKAKLLLTDHETNGNDKNTIFRREFSDKLKITDISNELFHHINEINKCIGN